MNNIQQFLEEEKREFAEKVTSIALTDYLIKSETRMDEAIKDHDTRLINFVLSEVEKEVREKYHCDSEEEQDMLSTLITNLRVK